jgi:hypothetical protein
MAHFVHVRLAILLAFAASAGLPAFAEDEIWTNYELKTRRSSTSPVELTLNGEIRFEPDGDVEQYALRPGIGLKLRDGLRVSGGYRYGHAIREGADQVEHRLWQQASYDLFSLGEIDFSGRTRVEQRFREGGDGTGHRVRQQFSMSRPLGQTGLKLVASDEMILGLNDTEWGNATGLQENRARLLLEWTAGGIGWKAGFISRYRNGINGAPDTTSDHLEFGISKSF